MARSTFVALFWLLFTSQVLCQDLSEGFLEGDDQSDNSTAIYEDEIDENLGNNDDIFAELTTEENPSISEESSDQEVFEGMNFDYVSSEVETSSQKSTSTQIPTSAEKVSSSTATFEPYEEKSTSESVEDIINLVYEIQSTSETEEPPTTTKIVDATEVKLEKFTGVTPQEIVHIHKVHKIEKLSEKDEIQPEIVEKQGEEVVIEEEKVEIPEEKIENEEEVIHIHKAPVRISFFEDPTTSKSPETTKTSTSTTTESTTTSTISTTTKEKVELHSAQQGSLFEDEGDQVLDAIDTNLARSSEVKLDFLVHSFNAATTPSPIMARVRFFAN